MFCVYVMLPKELFGPGKTIYATDPKRFIEAALKAFPHLDREFVTQICFEHPTRFNKLLPNFDVLLHTAQRTHRSVEWILANVTYDGSKSIHDAWAHHVDQYLKNGTGGSEVLPDMVKFGKWSFAPVIVKADFALSIGAPDYIGEPYYLIEGTHRVSYLARLHELGLITAEASLPLIEVTWRFPPNK